MYREPHPSNNKHHHKFKLEAVTVCVNYSDFLAVTLPHNKQFFDRYVVVTDTKDEKTHSLCEFYNVQCIQTDVFYEDGFTINKAAGINEGLKALDKDAWVVHLDADIWLPPLTRTILGNLNLDEDSIYGIDRMMCPDHKAWTEFIEQPKHTHQGHVFIYPDIFPLGVRIAAYKSDGYLPIGFFQLWHPNTSNVKVYPDKHGDIDRSDVLHAKNWPRSKRGFLPEIIAIHLDSEALGHNDMGKNWNGRKTKLFESPKWR
jgi:hypothetical protein